MADRAIITFKVKLALDIKIPFPKFRQWYIRFHFVRNLKWQWPR